MTNHALVGFKRLEAGGVVATLVYFGPDGAEAEKSWSGKVAAMAEAGEEFDYGTGFMLTTGRSLPCSAHVTTVTKPVFPSKAKSREFKLAKPAVPGLAKSHDDERSRRNTAEDLRAGRLNPALKSAPARKAAGATPPVEPKAELNEGGPTFEVWVKDGNVPTDYPPAGFAEVVTDALVRFRESGELPAAATAPEPVTTPPAAAVSPVKKQPAATKPLRKR